jgi:hypothetical protein
VRHSSDVFLSDTRTQIYAAIEYDPSEPTPSANTAADETSRFASTKMRVVVRDGSIAVRRAAPAAGERACAISFLTVGVSDGVASS